MILVTGGTGLVGSRLLYDLTKAGKRVRAIARTKGNLGTFETYTASEPTLRDLVEWVEADLLDLGSLEKATQGITAIYHCAAIVSFDPKAAKMMEQVNIEGTANLVNLALDLPNFESFTHVSSVATLGRAPGNAMLDEHSDWIPGKHNSNYAISKYGAEREVWRASAEGLPVVIVNPSIILGPGNGKSGSSALFKKVKDGFQFYTEGVSGFVDVADVTRAMISLTENKKFGERYILNADNITYRELFGMMAESMKVKVPGIKVSPMLSAIVWRLEKIRSLVTGKTPFITKETAYSAHQQRTYSGNKIVVDTGFKYSSLKESVINISRTF
jgi:nucleoside-diphosphate-sugar epimerase